ncbi:hypothetical protein JOC95_002699 [Bacillus tianshenii]|uniref:Uncharacterized protein n=1 Tax=Sutcliffiella tianshenii TaxID=1463404 RepID=A0ABS2P1U0_9BACI|nr:hypothetical protein [Bacillus tianshenii]
MNSFCIQTFCIGYDLLAITLICLIILYIGYRFLGHED